MGKSNAISLFQLPGGGKKGPSKLSWFPRESELIALATLGAAHTPNWQVCHRSISKEDKKAGGWKLPQDAVTLPHRRHWRDNQRSATIKRAADAVIRPPLTPQPWYQNFCVKWLFLTTRNVNFF